MTFQSKLYMSVGATSAYYTLRETYEHEYFAGKTRYTEIRSSHIQNLSQDFDEAFAKMLYISLQAGIPMREQSRSQIEEELREIKRASKADVEARQAAYDAQQKRWEEDRLNCNIACLSALKNGLITFGRYDNYQITDLPIGYVNWVMNNQLNFEEGSLIRALADELLNNYLYLRLPVANETEYYGQEKDKVSCLMTVIGKASYVRQNLYTYCNETVFIVTMVNENGICFVSKSPNFEANIGEKIFINAKVKKHETYNGNAQTIINYVKVKG